MILQNNSDRLARSVQRCYERLENCTKKGMLRSNFRILRRLSTLQKNFRSFSRLVYASNKLRTIIITPQTGGNKDLSKEHSRQITKGPMWMIGENLPEN